MFTFSMLPCRRLLLSQQRNYQRCCCHHITSSYRSYLRPSSSILNREQATSIAKAPAATVTATSKRYISSQQKRRRSNDKANTANITSPNSQQITPWEKILPPAEYFVSAQKSGALPFGRDTVVKIASRIWQDQQQLQQQQQQQQSNDEAHTARENLGKDICNEFAIRSIELTVLAYILNQSAAGIAAHDQSHPVRRLAAAIISIASAMEEPVAIMQTNAPLLLNSQPKSQPYSRLQVHSSSKLSSNTKEDKGLQKILDLADKSKIVEAMILAAEIYTRRHQKELAMKYWRMGAEYGSSHAMYMLAKLQARAGDQKGMKESLLQGTKSGNADCHFELAMDSARNDNINGKDDFLKNSLIAASSGIAVAAHNLGEYYRLHRQPQDIFVAEQWYRIGAESGIDWSMLQLSKILFDRGDYREATWWSNLASQGSPEVQSIATKFHAQIPAT